MSKIRQIQALVRNGLYYLTEHADNEALAEGFDIYDVEYAILTGKIRRSCLQEVSMRSLVRHWMDAPLGLSVA